MEFNSASTKMGYSLRRMDLAEFELSPRKVDGNDTTDDSTFGDLKLQNPQADMPSSFTLSSTTSSESCGPFCPCQCHKTTLVRSPLWFNSLFGSVMFSTNTTLSLSRRQCNMPRRCNRSGRLSAYISYFAPYWAVAREFSLFVSRAGIGGINADLALRAPRIIPNGSKIWSCIANGSTETVREMLVTGEASTYDVNVSGTSLLGASPNSSPDKVKLTV